MLTKLQKPLALALAALMLLSLAACGTGEGEVGNTEAPGTDAGTEAVTEDLGYALGLPDGLDYKTEVNYLYTEGYARDDELKSDELGGGVIADAVYERNLAVEDRLGVELYFDSKGNDTETASTIANLVQSGDKTIDIFVIGTYTCMTPVLAGHYLNLNAVENIDLTKSYWNQDYSEMMTFTDNDLQFVATSPTAISIFRMGYLTIFNRDMLKDQQLPDLYEVVDNGEWTLEYQYNLIKDIYVDSNGNSKKDIGDTFGFVVGAVTDMDVYAVSSNIHLAVRNEDGDLVYNTDAFERLVDMSEKVSALTNANGTYLAESFSEGFQVPIRQFADRKALMATTMFDDIETEFESLADMNYGIAPMPKLNKEQKEYGTYIQDQVSAFGISASIGDESRQAILGAVMEAMSYYSYKIVRPAYYESVLSLRFMQDTQSQAVLDTMFESISFDYVYATSLGGIRDSMRSVVSSSNPAVASQSKQWQRQVENALRSQQKAFDRLSEQHK